MLGINLTSTDIQVKLGDGWGLHCGLPFIRLCKYYVSLYVTLHIVDIPVAFKTVAITGHHILWETVEGVKITFYGYNKY